jgi:hypothetical protein
MQHTTLYISHSAEGLLIFYFCLSATAYILSLCTRRGTRLRRRDAADDTTLDFADLYADRHGDEKIKITLGRQLFPAERAWSLHNFLAPRHITSDDLKKAKPNTTQRFANSGLGLVNEK